MYADHELLPGGYVDLQVNGFVGVDFNDPATSVEQIECAAAALSDDGVVAALPTIITAELSSMCCCIRTVVAAIEAVARRQIFRGLHEGHLSQAGYIGAHPPERWRASTDACRHCRCRRRRGW